MNSIQKIAVIVLSASVMAACGQEDKTSLNSESSTVQTYNKQESEKHASEKLPVNIYMDNDYKVEGQQVGFQRTITNVEIKEFSETSELEFYEFYDRALRNQGLDLQKDYKLLEIDMKKEAKEEARSRPLEAFMLSDGSGLVIGDNELASQNEFLMYQQDFLATDFKVGKTLEGTGSILMAIPNEYADDPNLQLRIKQQIDDEKKYIYIDLN
ncbi:hypothetical protein [Metabacillus fastidiosus]|uniref:hypothetical protein n=1 Tax=Metabacillus fastidiosus TaxID=1458 RepID=UPI002E1D85E2|nr:hypothetical protein [Metabacillus fastidiosus]